LKTVFAPPQYGAETRDRENPQKGEYGITSTCG
jgi:hypothetical protein